MCCAPVKVPVMPRASQTEEAVETAAAARHAVIFAAASAPENRSAFWTPFSAFTAADPFTSRLNCGFVLLMPRELLVNRCTGSSVLIMESGPPVDGRAVIV